MARKYFRIIVPLLASLVLLTSCTAKQTPTASSTPVPTAAELPGYTKISDAAGLAAIAKNTAGRYVLTADIDMKNTPWASIEFTGVFDGNGHTISNLTITTTNATTHITIDGNHKEYPTNLAGLFSYAENALISNLTLTNYSINLNVSQHVFTGGIAGMIVDSTIINCKVSGRTDLYSSMKMFGAGGIAGFGTGLIKDCSADVTIVTVDTNPNERCENFNGGIFGCGYADIDGCTAKVQGYTSLTGYMHTGGLVGMYQKHIQNGVNDPGFYAIKNCSITAKEYYFENNPDKREYNFALCGEIFTSNNLNSISNTVVSFSKKEYFKFDKPLTPEYLPQ